jgi:adenylate cyclase
LGELPDWLSQRTAGNPFYVEEVLRALIEEGALVGARGAYRLTRPLASAAVPPTVQAILAARIDRLPETQKDLLQAASVIGKEFSESILARVVAGLPQPAAGEIEEGLRGLVQAELIQELAIYPEREYVFRHALTQEVSYGSQLTESRRRLHAAAAQALQDTLGDKLHEKAASVARHWENAGEMLPAAEWYCRAATWIGDRDLAGAAPLWTKVEEIARAIPDSIEARRLELSGCIGCLSSGFRFGISAEEAERLHARGCDLAEQLGDHEARTRIDSLRVRVQWSSGSVPETEEPPADVVDPETRIMLILDSVLGLQVTGRMREALALANTAKEMIEAQPELLNTTGGATLLGFRSLIATLLGELDVAAETIETAHRAARENGFEEILGWTYGWRASLKMARGDIEASITDGRRALEIAYKIGSTFSVGTGTLGLSNALWMKGDFEEVIRVCASSLESIRAQGAGIAFEAQILTFLGEGQLGLGDLDGARESIESAVELSRQRQNPLVTSRAEIARAELLLRSAGSAAGEAIAAQLDEVERVIDECGVELWRPLVHRTRAHLALAQGDRSAAQQFMRQAIEACQRMGAPASAAPFERELATM